MVETLLKAWRLAVPVLVGILIVLAYLRVRVFREVAEVTTRDDGKHWQTLTWEERIVYRRRVNLVSWAFVVVMLVTLAYGVWLNWYHFNFGIPF